MTAEQCGRCGADPAPGLATIGETRYCHGDDWDSPTCYMAEQQDRSAAGPGNYPQVASQYRHAGPEGRICNRQPDGTWTYTMFGLICHLPHQQPDALSYYGMRVVESRILPPGIEGLIVGPNTFSTIPPVEAPGPTVADSIREAVNRIHAQPMLPGPPTMVLHPWDYASVQVRALRDTIPDVNERRREGERIAERVGMEYWRAGVEGYKAPLALRLRWLPGTLRRKARRWADARIEAVPYVTRYVPVDGGFTTTYERHGVTWVRVGRWAIGKYDPEENW